MSCTTCTPQVQNNNHDKNMHEQHKDSRRSHAPQDKDKDTKTCKSTTERKKQKASPPPPKKIKPHNSNGAWHPHRGRDNNKSTPTCVTRHSSQQQWGRGHCVHQTRKQDKENKGIEHGESEGPLSKVHAQEILCPWRTSLTLDEPHLLDPHSHVPQTSQCSRRIHHTSPSLSASLHTAHERAHETHMEIHVLVENSVQR